MCLYHNLWLGLLRQQDMQNKRCIRSMTYQWHTKKKKKHVHMGNASLEHSENCNFLTILCLLCREAVNNNFAIKFSVIPLYTN